MHEQSLVLSSAADGIPHTGRLNTARLEAKVAHCSCVVLAPHRRRREAALSPGAPMTLLAEQSKLLDDAMLLHEV